MLAVMLVMPLAGWAEDASPLEDMVMLDGYEEQEDTIGIQYGTEVVVGSTTQLSGNFALNMWGSNSADLDVRDLLHGYSTIVWTRERKMTVNRSAISGMRTINEDDGSRTYLFTLSPDLYYNDGTPITAKDYVFSLLLSGAPEIAEIGGTPISLEYVTGYEAYQSGDANSLAGLRVISDYAFSINVRPEYLTYFYGLALLEVTPYPMSVIVPGCDIFDEGQGSYIGRAEDADTLDATGLPYTPGEFSTAMLQHTLLDRETGYVYFPRVTTGPYALETFDPQTGTATFVINEVYYGNYERQRPHIERITYKHVTNETLVDELVAGDVDLVNKVSSAAVVNQGLDVVNENQSLQFSNYLRQGLVFLSFACERGVTSSVAVRQAVARCLDKEEVVEAIMGNNTYGLPVYGYYGLGQWMIYQSFEEDTATGQEALNVNDEVKRLDVPKDLEEAQQLLIDDGWTLNSAGEAYADGSGEIRYRRENGELVPLVIKWAKTEGSRAADTVQSLLEGAFVQIGIGLEVTEMPFVEVLDYYYRDVERTYDMFFLSTNFNNVFDPYFDFNTAEMFQGKVNTTGLQDEELMELARDMSITPSTETRLYIEKWFKFQERFVEMMPMVPLYSNVLFDFYDTDIQDYNITQHPSWPRAIVYAYIGDEPVQADDSAEVGEESEDGLVTLD